MAFNEWLAYKDKKCSNTEQLKGKWSHPEANREIRSKVFFYSKLQYYKPKYKFLPCIVNCLIRSRYQIQIRNVFSNAIKIDDVYLCRAWVKVSCLALPRVVRIRFLQDRPRMWATPNLDFLIISFTTVEKGGLTFKPRKIVDKQRSCLERTTDPAVSKIARVSCYR